MALRGQLDRRGRDVERAAVLAAEAAGGDVVRRNVQYAFEFPVRAVAADRGAAPECHPDAALVVDCEPVGDTRAALDHSERTALGDLTRAEVEVERIDPIGHRVDVVHRPAVERPADPVRDGDVLEHAIEPLRARVAVERAAAGGVVERQAPDPEPSGCIADAVVHPQPLAVRDLDQRAHGFVVQIDHGQTACEGDQDGAVARRGGGADPVVEQNRAIVAARWIEEVQAAALDVDPEQSSGRGIPAWTFAQQRAGVDRDLHREKVA